MKSNFADLCIRRKLIGSFALVFVALVIQGVSFLDGLSSVNREVSAVVHDVQPALLASKNLAEELERASTALGFYLLSKEAAHRRAYESSFQKLDDTLRSLGQMAAVRERAASRRLLEEIGSDLDRFASHRRAMIELAQKQNKNIIALAFASENVNPLLGEVSQLLSQMILSEEEEEATEERKQIFAVLSNLRYAWINLVSEMRLFLAFRALAAKDNIALFRETFDDQVDQIVQFKDQLTFDQADALEQFLELRGLYYSRMETLISLHDSEKWRTDAWLIRTEIGPLVARTGDKITRLVSQLESLSKGATLAVADIYSSKWNQFAVFMSVVLVAVVLLAWFLVRNITRPLEQAIAVADGLTHGEMSEIEVHSNNETGRLMNSLKFMQESLKSRLRLESEVLEYARIRHALDKTTASIIVADGEHNIVYMNQTAERLFRGAQDEIRKALPGFNAASLMGSSIEAFFTDAERQRHVLANLTDTHQERVRLGKLTLYLTLNPVNGETGARIGTVAEWADRTGDIAVQEEVEAIVTAARAGDLSRRVDLAGQEGFHRRLAEGINALVDLVSHVFADIAAVMEAMSQGDLSRPMSQDYAGAFASVKDNVNTTLHDLSQSVGKILRSTNVINDSSSEIASGNTDLSERTEKQAASLEQTAASLAELTAIVRNNADNAQQANQLAASAQHVAEQGGVVVGNAVAAMEAINEASARMAEIIGVIDKIASQTNLLALNASVEAARAGDQGSGFSVIATEVRDLAQRSATAAQEINALIQDSVKKVQAGTELVNESGRRLEEIVNGVQKVGDIISEITAASSQQTAGIYQVNQTVQQMDEITQQNAVLAEKTSAASAFMRQQTEEMRKLLSVFTLSQTAPSSASATPGVDSAHEQAVQDAAASGTPRAASG